MTTVNTLLSHLSGRFVIVICGPWCLIVARNNLHQVEVSDIDLTAEFHTTPVMQQVAETVP